MDKRNGQSTLEYIIVLAIVIAAIVLFAKGGFKNKVTWMLNHSADQIEIVANRVNFEKN